MTGYIVKRLAYGLLVIAGVILIIFFLFNVLPVNSARLTLGQRADVSSVEAIEKELGLNLPLHKRLIKYVGELSPLWVHSRSAGEQEKFGYITLIPLGTQVLALKMPYLGRSYQTRKLVSQILAEKIPQTIILALASMLLASILGIAMGVFAAVHHNKFWDNTLVTLSVFGISQPSYFTGIVLALLFGYLWHDYTGLNHVGSLFELNDFGDEVINWKNLILPAIALGVRPVAIITQLTRSAMLDVLSQDYIRTARAKGLGFYTVIFKHALRNALNPVVTSISGWLAALLAGAYFVEIIFDYKGLGYETVKALLNFDFPVVMGSVLFTAITFVVINMLTDVVYAFLDPRISIAERS
ncbi:MAG: peptide ABC transporter permease [Chitinophagales bacterium]|nr:MAG: peptide ABC transporter permease [Chitinophagales bacterium]